MVYNEQSHSIRIMVNERDYWLKCLFMDKDTREKPWSNRIIVLWYSLVKWILCGWSTKCSFHTSTFYLAFVMLPVFPTHCNFKLLTTNLYKKILFMLSHYLFAYNKWNPACLCQTAPSPTFLYPASLNVNSYILHGYSLS